MTLKELVNSIMRSSLNYHDNHIGPSQYQDNLHRYYHERRTTEFWMHVVSFASGMVVGAITALAFL